MDDLSSVDSKDLSNKTYEVLLFLLLSLLEPVLGLLAFYFPVAPSVVPSAVSGAKR